ncbi:MAG: DUF1919 domain-containing protein [Lachnospiraceae bacterium]|nr:DUF1919 domain-containing protein [Lachnospiraceae bacterium]
MPYKVIIMLLGKLYEKYVNAIKYEELKGNIEVVAVGDIAPYAKTLDGWRLCTTEEALMSGFDYMIFSQGVKQAEEAAQTFAKIGISPDRVLPIEIFGSICFDFAQYVRLHQKQMSIIAINCWGGITSHYLHLKFRSPFVNLFLSEEDYLELLGDLQGYLALPLTEDTESEEAKKRPYPLGKLGGLTLYLSHYKSFSEAKALWDKRKARINWDCLFVMMYSIHRQIAERFAAIPYERKVIFTPEDFGVDCQICLKDYNAWIENMETDFWKSVNGAVDGHLQYYDPLKLLNGEKDFYRIEK